MGAAEGAGLAVAVGLSGAAAVGDGAGDLGGAVAVGAGAGAICGAGTAAG